MIKIIQKILSQKPKCKICGSKNIHFERVLVAPKLKTLNNKKKYFCNNCQKNSFL